MEHMDWREHIEAGPPTTVKRSGMSVDAVLALLAREGSVESILATTPGLSRDEVMACLAYAAEVIRRAEFVEGFKRGLEDEAAGRLTDDDDLWRELARERDPK